MKTPREILFARHVDTVPKLDVSALADERMAHGVERCAADSDDRDNRDGDKRVPRWRTRLGEAHFAVSSGRL